MQAQLTQINPRRLAALAALACALGALPASADAASVHHGSQNNLVFSAPNGENNDVIVSLTIGGVVFTDANAIVDNDSPTRCEQIDPHTVKCDDVDLESVGVYVNDGNNKVISGLPYPTTISAVGSGTNDLSGGDGNDRITGADGNDRLNGGPGNDELRGGDGIDTLFADAGADVLDGGDDADYADYSDRTANVDVSLDDVANDGSKLVFAEGDNVMKTVEHVFTGAGDDRVVGSDRDNLITAGPGDDRVDGGAGNDGVYGFEGDDRLSGGEGDDAVVGDTNGAPGGKDDLDGGAGDDIVWGRGGDDLLAGGSGRDEIGGGDGVDTVTYADATAPVIADLDGVTFDDGIVGEGDTLGADVENLIGGPFADRLGGGAGANALSGGAGDDTIDSRDGGTGDAVDCGDGNADTALADGGDAVTACELPAPAGPVQPGGPAQPENPKPGLPAGPKLTIGPKKLALDKRGYARIKVGCPAGRTCAGTLTVKSGKRTLAGGRFSVAAGTSKVVKVKVRADWRRRVARRAVTTSVIAKAKAGQSLTSTTTGKITLK